MAWVTRDVMDDIDEAAGRSAVLVTHPRAGHRVLLPGETTPRSTLNAHGGTDAADAELGAAAWRELTALLGLTD